MATGRAERGAATGRCEWRRHATRRSAAESRRAKQEPRRAQRRGHSRSDKVKASIALLGVESRIQRVTVDDAVFHRVRIGPISDLAELNRVRKRLHDAHIDAVVMKAME